MKKIGNYTNQFALSACLGGITFLCIIGRTLAPLWAGLILYAFVGFAVLSFSALKAECKPVRLAGIVGSVCFVLVILGNVLNMAERIYLVNSNTYPSFLGTDIGNVDLDGYMKAIDTECKGMGANTYSKDSGLIVIRCGNSWFSGKTFIGHVDMQEILKQPVKG